MTQEDEAERPATPSRVYLLRFSKEEYNAPHRVGKDIAKFTEKQFIDEEITCCWVEIRLANYCWRLRGGYLWPRATQERIIAVLAYTRQ